RRCQSSMSETSIPNWQAEPSNKVLGGITQREQSKDVATNNENKHETERNKYMNATPGKSFTRTGLDALLTPQTSVLILIDHQPFQFANVRNADPTLVLNNTIGLAKAAKAFGVPTILTTVIQDRGGFLPKDLQNVFPDQKPIDRTTINTWEDPRVVEAVK